MATYDDEYDVVLVCSAVNMASAALLMCKTAMELEKQSKKRKHSCLLVGSNTPTLLTNLALVRILDYSGPVTVYLETT